MNLHTIYEPLSRRPSSTSLRPLPHCFASGLIAAIIALGACAGGTAAPAGEPVPDPSGTAAELSEATAPTERRQITFGWTLDESGSRVRGRGVVRLQPPDRFRLDLFGPRNETVLAAAMIGDEARLPATAPEDVPIPSPALLWAGLGAIRPPGGTSLVSASSTGETMILRYSGAGDELYEYTVDVTEQAKLRQLQRLGSRGPLETVRVDRSPSGELARVSYRDWAAYRDLTLEIENSVEAAEFPAEIWSP